MPNVQNDGGLMKNAVALFLAALLSLVSFTAVASESAPFPASLLLNELHPNMVRAVAVGEFGHIYVTGTVSSDGQPATIDQYRIGSKGGNDIFVARFDSGLKKLLSYMVIGGTGDDEPSAIAIDRGGYVYITGTTTSPDIPIAGNGNMFTPRGGKDVFVAKLDAKIERLYFSSYLGGSGDDEAASLSIDSLGNIFVTGKTSSRDFPVTMGALFTASAGSTDVFIAKLDENLQSLLASTYLGGASNDEAASVVTDTHGNVYVAGTTSSSDFPVTLGIANSIFGGKTDAFVAQLDGNLHKLIGSTFFGGTSNDRATAMGMDSFGNVYVAGSTSSVDFPVASGGVGSPLLGGTDAFIARFDASLRFPHFSRLFGDASYYEVVSLAVDPSGAIYVTGNMISTEFPETPQESEELISIIGSKAFVAKLNGQSMNIIDSTIIGGESDTEAVGLTLNGFGNVYIAGNIVHRINRSTYVAAETGRKKEYEKSFLAIFNSDIDERDKLAIVIGSETKAGAPSGVASEGSPSFISPTYSGIIDEKDEAADLKKKDRTSKITGDVSKDKDEFLEEDNDEVGEVVGPGWFVGSAKRVSHEKAKSYFEKKRKELEVRGVFSPQVRTSAVARLSPSPPTSEIAELARGLRYDPKLIYDYVHNRIDYVPYYGSLKGATLTYYHGNGNDLDQSTLMIELLRASGYTARYALGTMTFPGDNVSNWFGVDRQQSIIGRVLGDNGIPYSNLQYNGTVTVSRVWVKAVIDGTEYQFDPAFKSYTSYNKIDIGQALEYNQADFMALGGGGADIGADYVRNWNENNVRNMLAQYSSNLVNVIRTQYPNSDVKEIIGGRAIVQTNLVEYSTTLPFQATESETWDEIPPQYISTLQVQHIVGSDNVSCNKVFNIPELGGKRLTLTYESNFPVIRLDGELVVKGTTATAPNYIYDLILKIDHPYAANNGTYMDQSATNEAVSGKTYAIIYDFGGGSNTLLQQRQRKLDEYRNQGLPDTSEAVLGETLNIMGLTYFKNDELSNRFLSTLADTVVTQQHQIGLMAQEGGYFIDIKTHAVTITSKRNIYADRTGYFESYSLVGSAFEHGVLEQLMGSDKPCVSTMKLFQIANATGKKLFLATKANYSTVRSQLINYSASDLNNFQSRVNSGSTLILPEDGQLASIQWRGNGFIDKIINSTKLVMKMEIGGGYFGGYGSVPSYVNPYRINQYANTGTYATPIPETTRYQFQSQYQATLPTSRDPIDMASGAFLYDRSDLSLGGNAPVGLSLARSYDSGLNLTKRTLGYGWTHNNDMYVSITSHGDPALGKRQPVDAASMIATLYVVLDIVKNLDNAAQGWMAASLATKWGVDQLIENTINIHIGKKVMEFVNLADGTYEPPPGITMRLVKNPDNTFSLLGRFATRTDFNANNQVSFITDADGNTMSFSYFTDNTLSTVRDAFGRSLAFIYTDGRITVVSDSAGRTVSYGYDANGDLTTYTDPENKVWRYGYDNHRITTLTDALSVTTITNVYDSFDRVKQQIAPRQGGGTATYNFFYSRFRNQEEDPEGNTTTYYFDEKGRSIGEENALGDMTAMLYDGQGHIVQSIDLRGNSTYFFYDGQHNQVQVTNAFGDNIVRVYDSQFHLTDTYDPLGHRSHFEYDPFHHLTLTSDHLNNSIGATYNNPNGFRDTATDARGTKAFFAYDTFGNPRTFRTGDHVAIAYQYDSIGRLKKLTDQVGSSTNFEYDKRGFLETVTDPLMKVTTYTPDNVGRVLTATDRNNRTTVFSYTPTGKPDTVTYADNTTVRFVYDQLDNMREMWDSTGVTRYFYDRVNRLDNVTGPTGFIVKYVYDEAGNLTELTYPGGKKVKYDYDALNRMKTVRIDWLSQTATYNYVDGEAGLLDNAVQFNGIVTTFDYDEAHRLTGMNSPVAGYSFPVLDGNGNRKQVVQNEPLTPLTGVASTDYIYNEKSNRLLAAGASAFTYNDEGQLSAGYGTSYTFDVRHRLTGIGNDTFSYAGSGNRLRATRNGVTTLYVHDAAGNLLAEVNGADNTITTLYVHGLGLLAMVKPADNVILTDQVYCYHFNPVGSTVAITDQNQEIVNAYSYDPFGNLLAQNETIPQPFKFVGQLGVMSEPNGFYYMRARYYDPNVGRFISEDPIGFKGGDVNLMAYVGNNPVNLVDPSGLDPKDYPILACHNKPQIYVSGSATFLMFNVDNENNLNVNLPPYSIGMGPELRISPPNSNENYISPWVGLGKNLSIGTNIVFDNNNKFLRIQGLNVNPGVGIGLPVGVQIPGGKRK